MQTVRGKSRRCVLLVVVSLILIIAVGSLLAVLALQFDPPQDGRSWDTSTPVPVADNLDWQAVGGDAGQTKYSPLAQITAANVGRLQVAWTYRTGEMERRGEAINWSKFEATPIIADNKLVLCTPFNRVAALDPATGEEFWVFDAEIDTSLKPINNLGCRGLARWVDTAASPDTPCAERLYMATNDRRLFALDAHTGARCEDFGENGEVIVIPLAETHDPLEVHINAAPAVVGDVVVVGSSIADNERSAAASGRVHAFDTRTGKLSWKFDPVPRSNGKTGAGNVWSSISADPDRDLVFLPTSSPSPDFFGGEREGDESLANSIVAVRASTGAVVWSFQTVHHDLWDYDIPAAPALFTLRRDGGEIPAMAFATKSAFLFVLDRETGKPLYPVIERSVPQTDVPGERTSPTQPFSTLPTLARQSFSAEEAFGIIGIDKMKCRSMLENIRNEGIFTPPSLGGSALVPSRAGGAEWGGVAIDPTSNRLIVNTNSFPIEIIKLIPREEYDRSPDWPAFSAPQTGARYAYESKQAFSQLGMPCTPPPWGLISAIDLDTGKLAWRKPLGTTSSQAPFGIALNWGTPNFGGPLMTAGGLVFIAATTDDRLRALRVDDGEEIWAVDLPASAQASPMTYAVGGRQYVVLAAGGHGMMGTKKGDYVIAYALPGPVKAN
ncbi:MAG: pyrroloquinoline quinone-dependent dehydrogenase [Novosphingobium sp.]|nr:pyrroloquinoline quinone-dependent dehydrogenase [Novosphingobium sp.]